MTSDPAARSRCLAKLRSRVLPRQPLRTYKTPPSEACFVSSQGACPGYKKVKRNITLVLPYVQQLARLGLHSLWLEHVASVIPLGFRVAYSVQPNAMRKLYRLNWTDTC